MKCLKCSEKISIWSLKCAACGSRINLPKLLFRKNKVLFVIVVGAMVKAIVTALAWLFFWNK